VCGPTGWMMDVIDELKARGVGSVEYENFGPRISRD
jgi:ferredoxin-NADP reductase